MGTMENKKRQTREKIHENALKLFEKKGFDKTKMRKIAEKSNIAVGTLYNYYNSKASLILSLFEEKFENISFNNQDIIEKFKKNKNIKTLDVLYHWLEQYVNMFFILQKETYKELFKIMYNDEKFLKRGMKVDEIALKDLNELLYFLKERGELKKDLNIEEISFSIFSLFFGHNMGYLYYFKDMSKQEFLNSIKRKIKMLYEGIKK